MMTFRVTVLLAICFEAYAGGDAPLPEKIAPPTRIPFEVTDRARPSGRSVNPATIPRVVRRAVVADAARRFEVAASAVVLSQAEQVTWGDGSLGCPRPGMSFTQALVPGFRVVASTQGGTLLYHTDSLGDVVSCVQPAPRTKPPGASRR